MNFDSLKFSLAFLAITVLTAFAGIENGRVLPDILQLTNDTDKAVTVVGLKRDAVSNPERLFPGETANMPAFKSGEVKIHNGWPATEQNAYFLLHPTYRSEERLVSRDTFNYKISDILSRRTNDDGFSVYVPGIRHLFKR